MHVRVWKAMFDVVIDEIEEHVMNLLRMEALDGCQFLCMVGGFSCSKYLQYKIKTKFGRTSKELKKNLMILIPDKPVLSVVKGAAYFGQLSL